MAEKKTKYLGVKILDDAQTMTRKQAIEEGLLGESAQMEANILAAKKNAEEPVEEPADQDGYKVTYSDGSTTWMQKEDFEEVYTVLTDVEEKFLKKYEGKLANELKIAGRIRTHVEDVQKAKTSLKQLGEAVLKSYKVDLDKIDNQNQHNV